MQTPTQDVLLCDIDLDRSPRVRHEDNADYLKDLVAAYAANKTLPPPVVYVDKLDGYFRCADGRHRIKAAQVHKIKSLACVVKTGTATDCLLEALRSNATHGLRRTNDDKWLCAKMALEAFPARSDREIAAMTNLSQPYIWAVRKDEEQKITAQKANESRSSDNVITPRQNLPTFTSSTKTNTAFGQSRTLYYQNGTRRYERESSGLRSYGIYRRKPYQSPSGYY